MFVPEFEGKKGKWFRIQVGILILVGSILVAGSLCSAIWELLK